ncbi:fasciclin domain-containing protein [Pseudoflavitalea sp. G-6-1-2]|uniref:fasciclin domain-containing protein n=1 Tax=Pseudoflavitalea sp. G-6-1-2 TaxID=2728841 RepID=UPI00146EF6E6|nr:fasciclin domain-containing protein [Pseudoflavitalea sp. G-6-1-2]NML20940.1 fasciclin domain-containing protein [Pseudoflavitalea sp. G-6-1-2]
MKCAKALLYLPLFTMLGISSCVKDSDLQPNGFDNNKINLVVADNFNLSSFSAALRRSSLDKYLQNGEGPYTLLAPSDLAFSKAGYGSAVAVLAGDPVAVTKIANYHTMEGKYELNKLPFLFNQELTSRGGKLYATHWVKGNDTVLTLNGAKVVATNIPASNGLIQVINQVLTPYQHDKISSAIASESSITLFFQALKTSGLLSSIDQDGAYTIFAPTNAAMEARGYKSVQQILQTDPSQLKELVNYHIVRDRRFIYDYILSTGASNTTKQAMMNGITVDVKLLPDPDAPGSFNSISLRGIGNTSDVNLSKRDILTGNGVLHVIDQTLRVVR